MTFFPICQEQDRKIFKKNKNFSVLYPKHFPSKQYIFARKCDTQRGRKDLLRKDHFPPLNSFRRRLRRRKPFPGTFLFFASKRKVPFIFRKYITTLLIFCQSNIVGYGAKKGSCEQKTRYITENMTMQVEDKESY